VLAYVAERAREGRLPSGMASVIRALSRKAKAHTHHIAQDGSQHSSAHCLYSFPRAL
jgi:hypothetical protein